MGFLKDAARGFAQAGVAYYQQSANSNIELKRTKRMAEINHTNAMAIQDDEQAAAKDAITAQQKWDDRKQWKSVYEIGADGEPTNIQTASVNINTGETKFAPPGVQGTLIDDRGKSTRQNIAITAETKSAIRQNAHARGMSLFNNEKEADRLRDSLANDIEKKVWDAAIAEMRVDASILEEAMRGDTALEISDDRNYAAWRLLQSSNAHDLIKLNDQQSHDQWKTGYLASGLEKRLKLQIKSDKVLKEMTGEQALEELVKRIAAAEDLSEQEHDQLEDRLKKSFGYNTELKSQSITGQIKVQDAGYVWKETLQNKQITASQRIAEMQDKLSRDMMDKQLTSKEKLHNLMGLQRQEQATLEAELQTAVNNNSAANRRGENDAKFQQTRTLLQMNQAFSAGEEKAKQAFTLTRDAQQAEEQIMKMYVNFNLQGGRDVIKTVQVEKQDEFGSTYMVPMSIKESPEGDVTKIWFDNQWVDPALPKDLKPATEPAISKARGLLKKAQDVIEGYMTSDLRDYRALGTTKAAYAERFMKDALQDAGYSYTIKQRPPKSIAAGVEAALKANPGRDPEKTRQEAEASLRKRFPDLE